MCLCSLDRALFIWKMFALQKNDVKQVWTLRENLPSLVIQGNDSQKILQELLISCVTHDSYLAHPTGVNFLSYLFTLSESLTEKLHDTIKTHLVNCTRFECLHTHTHIIRRSSKFQFFFIKYCFFPITSHSPSPPV